MIRTREGEGTGNKRGPADGQEDAAMSKAVAIEQGCDAGVSQNTRRCRGIRGGEDVGDVAVAHGIAPAQI